jgi:hypothetical protein
MAFLTKKLPSDKEGWVSIVGNVAIENRLGGKPGRTIGTIVESGDDRKLAQFKAQAYDDKTLVICRSQKWVKTGSEGVSVMLGLGGMGSEWGATVITYHLVATSKPKERSLVGILCETISRTVGKTDKSSVSAQHNPQKL